MQVTESRCGECGGTLVGSICKDCGTRHYPACRCQACEDAPVGTRLRHDPFCPLEEGGVGP